MEAKKALGLWTMFISLTELADAHLQLRVIGEIMVYCSCSSANSQKAAWAEGHNA